MTEKDRLIAKIQEETEKRALIAKIEEAKGGKGILESAGEVVADAIPASLQGFTGGYGDEILGGVIAAGKKVGGNPEPLYPDLYESSRDDVRDWQDAAAKRSPITTAIRGMQSSYANPLLRGGGVLKNIAQGVAQGIGYSNEDTAKGVAQDAALGGVMSGAADVVGKVAGIPFKDPNAIRARALGAEFRDFNTVGPKDIDEMVDTLKGANFYTRIKSNFDIKTNQWKPASKSVDSLEADTPERLMERIQTARTQMRAENVKSLQGKTIPASEVDDALNQASAVRTRPDLPQTSLRENQEYLDNWLLENTGLTRQQLASAKDIDASVLEKLKTNLQEAASNMGAYSQVEGSKEKAALLKDLAYRLRKSLEAKGGSKYAANNKLQQALYTQEEDIRRLMNKDLARGPERLPGVRGKLGQWGDAIADVFTGDPRGALNRADMAEGKFEIPFSRPNIPSVTLPAIPGAGIPPVTTPQLPHFPTFQAPQGSGAPIMEMIRKAPARMIMQQGGHSGRSPQSVSGFGSQAGSMLVNQKLPRSTPHLLNVAPFAKAKVSMMLGPEAGEQFAAMIDSSPPEALPRMLAAFSNKNPGLFEYDSRNRWDGKMHESVDRQAGIQEIRNRKDLSSIERAKIIQRINKDGIME